ncbi:hypothetical protein L1987_09780 [Smallanthus sonchifolius]|uniref:Uncharacterized protein n=1 Tax=Smallanthus sonchifolius TaxID=185202 RepID=A0ACB9JQ98_9ASTR|nr:hypothetical protein L1987_09780 [Smallanthus sonchifolius]
MRLGRTEDLLLEGGGLRRSKQRSAFGGADKSCAVVRIAGEMVLVVQIRGASWLMHWLEDFEGCWAQEEVAHRNQAAIE